MMRLCVHFLPFLLLVCLSHVGLVTCMTDLSCIFSFFWLDSVMVAVGMMPCGFFRGARLAGKAWRDDIDGRDALMRSWA